MRLIKIFYAFYTQPITTISQNRTNTKRHCSLRRTAFKPTFSIHSTQYFQYQFDISLTEVVGDFGREIAEAT